jgi:hypothetical protein
MNIVLWILQVILALLFLWGGIYKLAVPLDQIAPTLGVSVPFLKFISVCEVLGGLGLVLPAALRIKPVLTTLAAIGLLIIMVGAVSITAKIGGAAQAILPLVTGILLLVVAYGRWRLAPISEK